MNNNQSIFILRERFTKSNKSRATIVGKIDEKGNLIISGAKCKAKDFRKRDGVKYAVDRLNNSEPWVTIPMQNTSEVFIGSVFGAIARRILKNIDAYYQPKVEKIAS